VRRSATSQVVPTIYIVTISHIYAGGRRKISEREGFWVYLIGRLHNQSDDGVHGKNGHALDMKLKQDCQRKYEEKHSREEFMLLIGKNYLD
jgi:hypothetical protein